MKVLLVRHAPAEDRQEFAKSGKADTQRPLTREGRSKMRQVAQSAAVILPAIDMIVSSPLTRAMQTARILAAAYPDTEVARLDTLAPAGEHAGTLKWLADHSNLRCVAMVGHEPALGELLSTMLVGSDATIVEFKKGGMALLEFDGKPAAGGAFLHWSIPPGVLRMIDRGKKA